MVNKQIHQPAPDILRKFNRSFYTFDAGPKTGIMQIHQQIINARKKKGLTQEQLADQTGITSRTIQRIESGESSPRPFTLKTIASALGISFEELVQVNNGAAPAPGPDVEETPKPARPVSADDDKHLLEMICLACFSFLVVPLLHFLIPSWLLKKSGNTNPGTIAYARKLIRTQLYWKISLWIIMLLTLAYNLTRAVYFERTMLVNYLWPFFILYFTNAIIITASLVRIKRLAAPVEIAF